jgi:hypothetical protein
MNWAIFSRGAQITSFGVTDWCEGRRTGRQDHQGSGDQSRSLQDRVLGVAMNAVTSPPTVEVPAV